MTQRCECFLSIRTHYSKVIKPYNQPSHSYHWGITALIVHTLYKIHSIQCEDWKIFLNETSCEHVVWYALEKITYYYELHTNELWVMYYITMSYVHDCMVKQQGSPTSLLNPNTECFFNSILKAWCYRKIFTYRVVIHYITQPQPQPHPRKLLFNKCPSVMLYTLLVMKICILMCCSCCTLSTLSITLKSCLSCRVCSAVVSMAHSSELWRECSWLVVSFSRNRVTNCSRCVASW